VKGLRKELLWLAVQVVFILCLQVLLKHWMAGGHVAATLLSAGPQTPRLVLVGACLFIAVRLFTILLLPGLVLASLGGMLYDYAVRRKGPAEL
jgi:hypothetical protein